MVMLDKEVASVETKGTNDDGSLVGSHHLIVELIKTIVGLDADDCIITGFEAKIRFIKNDQVEHMNLEYIGKTTDGAEVAMDLTQFNFLTNFDKVQDVKKRALFKFIDEYASGDDKGWMDYVHFKDMVDKILFKVCMVYKKKLIAAILDVSENNLLNGDTVSWMDMNDLFYTLDIPFKIRRVGDKYAIDRI